MAERPEPDHDQVRDTLRDRPDAPAAEPAGRAADGLDRVRDALREHDERAEDASDDDAGEAG